MKGPKKHANELERQASHTMPPEALSFFRFHQGRFSAVMKVELNSPKREPTSTVTNLHLQVQGN